MGSSAMENLSKVINKTKQAVANGLYSPFKIVGSAGIDSGIGSSYGNSLSAGGTAQKFEILNVNTNEKRWLGFIGVGLGVGVGPATGGSASAASFPSTGSRIVMGYRQWTSNFDWKDLEGNTFIYSFSAGAGAGVSLCFLSFNYAVSEYYSYGIGVVQGVSVSSPGVGVMNFTGVTKYI